jgi:hypothetical protein
MTIVTCQLYTFRQLVSQNVVETFDKCQSIFYVSLIVNFKAGYYTISTDLKNKYNRSTSLVNFKCEQQMELYTLFNKVRVK